MTHGLAKLRGRISDKGSQSDCDDEQAENKVLDKFEIGTRLEIWDDSCERGDSSLDASEAVHFPIRGGE